jgi:WD40 repeat protein
LMPYPPNKVFMANLAPPRSVTVLETRAGREICTLAVPKDQLVDAAFHPDGQVLTVSGGDNVLRFWDATTGQPTRTLSLGGYPLNRFVISPDGRRLAASSVASKATHQVKVWDLQTGEVIAAFSGHAGNVMTVALSPDGRRLASGGSDKAVMIWDVGAVKQQLVLRGHTGAITDVTFNPDGNRVASCDGDSKGTIRIWDVGPIETPRGP